MKNLVRFFNIIVLFIPLTLSLVFSLVCFCFGWERWLAGHSIEFYFGFPMTGRLASLITCLLLITVMFVIQCLINKYIPHPNTVELFVIIIVALILRLTVVMPNKDSLIPFSDFNRIWEMIHGNLEDHLDYYSLFPAYLNYTILLKYYIRIVGDKFVNVLYLNVVLSTCTVAVIYFITREVTHNKTTSFLAALLYAVMPSNILYCSVMTPEFITVFFDSFGVLLILIAMRSKLVIQTGGQLILAGILIGIGSAYKPFGIIIMIALVMCLLCLVIIKHVKWKDLLICILAFLLVLSSYRISKEIIRKHTEREIGIELNESNSVPHFLLVGLNTEGEGQIHLGNLSRRYYQTYLENGFDVDEAKATAYELLKNDWRENRKKIPDLILRKMIWAWQDDQIPLRYFTIATGDSGDKTCFGLSIATLSQAFYLMIMLGAVIGAMMLRKNIELNKEFLLLIIFGFFCLILLSEAQSRYKCLIMPFMCVISSMGVEGIERKIHLLLMKLTKCLRESRNNNDIDLGIKKENYHTR